jgi:hypothetical protein
MYIMYNFACYFFLYDYYTEILELKFFLQLYKSEVKLQMDDLEELIQPSGSVNATADDQIRSDDITSEVSDEPYFAGVVNLKLPYLH